VSVTASSARRAVTGEPCATIPHSPKRTYRSQNQSSNSATPAPMRLATATNKPSEPNARSPNSKNRPSPSSIQSLNCTINNNQWTMAGTETTKKIQRHQINLCFWAMGRRNLSCSRAGSCARLDSVREIPSVEIHIQHSTPSTRNPRPSHPTRPRAPDPPPLSNLGRMCSTASPSKYGSEDFVDRIPQHLAADATLELQL